ncbi:hypothetical protein CK503_09195 [Aliifodinibius salipaludis]|uniref:DUF998 domain-containing protein n=1 Tax=Fodinibius salipaludis TaxID=2032627 RepID=A0A2A2GAG2_9BACT|nr:DUF998 domain-containing protein [Aliifodinibius salipaludis]PAU93839.1 hypothetical protein CK503_09195 [Aliifodinibius salipaludis]
MFKNDLLNYSGILGAFLFMITTAIGGALFDGYSHISQYISESYAYGTEYGHLLRWLGYIPSGLLIGFFHFMVAKKLKDNKYIFIGLIGFGILYGIFTSLVSVFPCDFGCNRNYSDSSVSQFIHTVLSLFTYALTPFSIYFTGVGFKKLANFKVLFRLSTLLSIAVFTFGMVFLLNANSPIAGLLQRITEAMYLFWIIYFSVFLIKYNKRLK